MAMGRHALMGSETVLVFKPGKNLINDHSVVTILSILYLTGLNTIFYLFNNSILLEYKSRSNWFSSKYVKKFS